MKKVLFIFNPTSGRAHIKSKLFEIVEYYTKHDYVATIYPTQQKGDAYNFICQLKENYDLVVCSGGDGTLSEVISGFLYTKNYYNLSYIPSGSVNDFGRSVGISTELTDALPITLTGIPYQVDIGKFNDSYFTYVAGFGLFTNVSYTTPQKRKNIIGHLAYVLEGIKAISELKSYKIVLTHDSGTIEGSFIFGLVTNSFSVAGLKPPFHSMTTLNDGVFEILLIQMPKNIIELQEIVVSLLNETFESKLMICFQSSSLMIHSEPMSWTLDGEFGGQVTDVRIDNLKQAVSIIVPDSLR